jgi:hypothetical protein
MAIDVLKRAHGLTQAIESAIAEGDWVRASSLAQERSPLLMGLQADQTPEALAIIREIQRIDAAIAQQAHAGQERLVAQQSQSMYKISATSMYHKTGMMECQIR